MKLAVHGIGYAGPFDACPVRMEAVYQKSPKGTVDHLKDLSYPFPGEGDDAIGLLKAEVSGLEQYVAKSKLRRVDKYSRMALLAAGRTLADSGLSSASRERTGVIVATGYGALESTFSFLDSYIERGDKLAFPTHFSNSVHNAAAAHISICYEICGPTLTVSQFDLSFISALITAGTWLETEKTDAVLVGAVDEWCELTGYCMQKFSENSDTSPRSFGEGAVFFLVTGEKTTPAPYGYFNEVKMGRNLYEQDFGPGDVIFSPSSAALGSESLGNALEKLPGLWKRKLGNSPTDMAMDAFFAFKCKKDNGREVCCLKQGEDGIFGKVLLTVAKET